MESVTSDEQRQLLISSFLEYTPAGQTVEIAINFLKATNWKLVDAINLFLIARTNPYTAMFYQQELIPDPLASKMDTLYFPIWDPITRSLSSSSMYRPPPNLFFKGSFEDAKATSYRQDLWLLVNFQFTTHALNRDFWSAVSQAITSSFILCQVYDRTSDGQKISTFYKIESAPLMVLLIDPITGLLMRMWSGMIEPQGFLEDLMNYMDAGPQEHISSDLLFKQSLP